MKSLRLQILVAFFVAVVIVVSYRVMSAPSEAIVAKKGGVEL